MENKNLPLITITLSGLFAILGTIVGGVVQGYWNVQLAERKYQSDLVLKALESSSAEERLQTLKLLVHTNLIKESDVRDSVSRYILQSEKDPETIPQIKPAAAQSLEPPIINNARLYLLTGSKNKAIAFTDLNSKLTSAGFKVMGAKNIIDVGRPDAPEVRYFNMSDQQQAEKIAEFVRFKFDASNFAAKYYVDAKAKPGYIEIWLGR
ncbi:MULTISPECIES: hypothetical protein [unclassified Mucilaginibacter]|uniref:hypothetical protein n=1 Tax=unclassified Mucilaginibacter TaxID=2617802 RepID=UPI0031F71294